MSGALCSATGVRGPVEVRRAESTVDRLVGDEKHCATLRLRLELEVVSDYLHVGVGAAELLAPLEHIVLPRGASFEEKLEAVASLVGRGVPVRVKRQYSCRGAPAIPGSTVKGAARSRVELGSCGSCRGGKVLGEMLYGNEEPLQSLPPRGRHGWRHARIWCESVFEARGWTPPSVLDDLFGVAGRGVSLGSRVYFSEFKPVGRVSTEIIVLDHGEALEAIPRGSRFQGEVLLVNVSLEDIGVVLYGLGLDKSVFCGRDATLLLGASKYRCRVLEKRCTWRDGRLECSSEGRTVKLGVVRVKLVGVEYSPWSRCRFPDNPDILSREALEAAIRAYPELRTCRDGFDEVERRLILECGSRGGAR